MEERQGRPWTGHQSIAGQHTDIQDKQPCKHTFTSKGNLERPVYPTVLFLDCGRKPEYLVRTHTCTGRTCKLQAERPSARSRTQDLLAARQQCYQLLHRAGVSKISFDTYGYHELLYVPDPTCSKNKFDMWDLFYLILYI
ncbi:hypothetical protein GOODEAATRI_029549 [Goodea atripinnis]|uniref:Uncharacterized protein n=1 Tax=Goodea atripinnis TaxID=208336 RepID=A0ABV0MLR1_9TELE